MITSSRHDKARIAKRKKTLGLIFGVVLIVLLFRSPVENILSHIIQFVAHPFFLIENNTRETVTDYGYVFKSKKSLLEDNRRLQDTLDLTVLDGHSREVLRKENEDLKILLGRNSGRTLVLARVLATPGISPYDSLIIDAGSNEGLQKGMRIFTDGDFAIGEVSRVYVHSSVVTLYSTNGTELPVTINISSSSSVPTLGYGIGGGNIRAILPKGTNVAEGDLVEIPSISPVYAGTIDAVVKSNESSLQEVYFKLPLNIYSLRYVYIALDEEVLNTETE